MNITADGEFKNMNILLMMQGHSGSGKSTLAEIFKSWFTAVGQDVVICSTDDQFKVNGVYKFDPSKLGVYHKLNLDLAVAALEAGKTVIVDNTNTQAWECKGYVLAAMSRNIPVFFHRAIGNYQNTHGVPSDKVEQMKNRLEVLTVDSVLASRSPWEK